METRIAQFESARVLAERGVLFAVLDACDSAAVPAKLRGIADGQARSLFKGTTDERSWAIAPYLTKVTPDILTWIASELWNDHWGIFAVARSEYANEFETLWGHLRHFLVVNAADHWLYCRFYDPRVLTPLLDCFMEEQREQFFGPFSMFGIAEARAFEKSEAKLTWLVNDERAARQSLAAARRE